jgi:hypothetical protein
VRIIRESLGGKDADEDKNRLGIGKAFDRLVLVEGLVLNARLVGRYALDGDQALPVGEEAGAGRRVGEEEPDDDSPQAGRTTELSQDISLFI